MNSPALIRAVALVNQLCAEIQAVHTEAIDSRDSFAELCTFDLIAPARELQRRIGRVQLAAEMHASAKA